MIDCAACVRAKAINGSGGGGGDGVPKLDLMHRNLNFPRGGDTSMNEMTFFSYLFSFLVIRLLVEVGLIFLCWDLDGDKKSYGI